MSVIIKPIISEKMSAASEKFNRYGFLVQRSAGMIEGKKQTLKKATVFLGKDDKIDIYSNI